MWGRVVFEPTTGGIRQLADGAVDLIGPGLVVVVVEEGTVHFDGRGRLDGQFLLVVRGQVDWLPITRIFRSARIDDTARRT